MLLDHLRDESLIGEISLDEGAPFHRPPVTIDQVVEDDWGRPDLATILAVWLPM